MEIRCKRCDAEIPVEDINIDRLVAKCKRCNAVFGFADSLDGAGQGRRDERLDIPLPKGFKMQRSGAGLAITWRWFSLQYIFLTVFALFWDGFLIFWYSMALRSDDWLPILFPIIHVAVGVGLTYSVLAGYLNKTRIQVTPRSLEIEHGPLPWPGKRLEASYVKQLYCKERIHHGKNSTSYSYELRAVTHDGGDQRLLKGLEGSEQALYLEQEIEKFLRIEDRPIRGELER